MPGVKPRVKVWEWVDPNDPEAGYLGEGEFMGNVPLSEVISEEEQKENFKAFCLRTLDILESDEDVLMEEVNRMFAEMNYSERTTPKIRLDSGKIVYGCQIWWEAI